MTMREMKMTGRREDERDIGAGDSLGKSVEKGTRLTQVRLFPEKKKRADLDVVLTCGGEGVCLSICSKKEIL